MFQAMHAAPLPVDHTGLPAYPDPRARRLAWTRRSDGWIEEVVNWQVPDASPAQVAAFFDQAARKARYVAAPSPASAPAPRVTGGFNRVFLRSRDDGTSLIVYVEPAGPHGAAATIRLQYPAPPATTEKPAP
jgi:hypothetical protein